MSFDLASDTLERLCGMRVSDQTVRRACEREGERAQTYLQSQSQATEPIAQADGDLEWSTDGAKVNTTEGWREIRGLLACKRERGEPAGVAQWQARPLPQPHVKLAWAAIATSDQVGAQWQGWANALDCGTGEGVSVVADGAAWIWKQARACLPDHEGVLDVYHLLEHLHAAGRALHGEGEPARHWAEHQRAALFRHGARAYLRDHLAPRVKTYTDFQSGGRTLADTCKFPRDFGTIRPTPLLSQNQRFVSRSSHATCSTQG